MHKITLNTLLLGRNNVGNTMHIEYTSNREANFWVDWMNAWNVDMLILWSSIDTMVRRITSLVTFTPLWNPSPNQDELICRPPPQPSGLICLLSLQRCRQRVLKLVITLVYGITMFVCKGNVKWCIFCKELGRNLSWPNPIQSGSQAVVYQGSDQKLPFRTNEARTEWKSDADVTKKWKWKWKKWHWMAATKMVRL